jgi:hypothetical protein
MEAAVLLGILGAGYFLNNKESKEEETVALPLETDSYKTNYFEESDDKYKLDLLNNYNESKIPGSTILNYQNVDQYINKPLEDNNNNDDYIYSNIAGGKILKDNFLVNDQGIKVEPFFKGQGPANANLTENRRLNSHQGNSEFKTAKTEQPNFFQPFKQGNVFGSQFEGDFLKQKYVTSNINNNVLPFEQQMVQPMDIKSSVIGDINRQYYEKNKTENIRTLNNQKQSYEGRVLAGESINQRGKIGQVFKHTPDIDYFNSADKWLVTNGAYTAKMERPEEIVPATNRQCFNKQDFGPAYGVDVEEPANRPKFAVPRTQNFDNDPIRNAGTSVNQMNLDSRTDSVMIYPNERQVTGLRTYDSNLKPEYDKETMRLQDKVKNTIKETTIDSANNGYLTGPDLPESRLQDNVKNTKKQHTTYDENYMGVGGTVVPQPVNEEQYYNAETNATKEIVAQGRYPCPEGDKYYNSVETYNIDIKKHEPDYFNHRQTHYDRMNPEYLAKNTCEFTHFKDKLDDKSIGSLDGGRIDPNLLTPFKNNPYTQSLESFAY